MFRSPWCPRRTSWLFRTAARRQRPSPHSATIAAAGLVERLSQSSFEVLGDSRRLASSRTACRYPRIGRGTRWRRHRAALGAHSTRLAGSDVRVGPGLTRQSGHPVGSWSTAGVFQVSRFWVSPSVRRSAPLCGSFERRRSHTRFVRRGLIRRAVQHANGAVAPDGLCDPVTAARGSFATLDGFPEHQES